jgi:hypothetical protein
MNCGICGEAKHTGSCIQLLKRLLADAREELTVRQEQSNNELVRQENSNRFNKREYQREYMRTYRAKTKIVLDS